MQNTARKPGLLRMDCDLGVAFLRQRPKYIVYEIDFKGIAK